MGELVSQPFCSATNWTLQCITGRAAADATSSESLSAALNITLLATEAFLNNAQTHVHSVPTSFLTLLQTLPYLFLAFLQNLPNLLLASLLTHVKNGLIVLQQVVLQIISQTLSTGVIGAVMYQFRNRAKSFIASAVNALAKIFPEDWIDEEAIIELVEDATGIENLDPSHKYIPSPNDSSDGFQPASDIASMLTSVLSATIQNVQNMEDSRSMVTPVVVKKAGTCLPATRKMEDGGRTEVITVDGLCRHCRGATKTRIVRRRVSEDGTTQGRAENKVTGASSGGVGMCDRSIGIGTEVSGE
eukprot:GFKZ01000706.1.p1 GENE.GFKZ01000706.1~~GFKZ01000706.1.p1  ORF type:complete len:302 (+),score=31.13 GFKZ01000706.1:386-1291(+)